MPRMLCLAPHCLVVANGLCRAARGPGRRLGGGAPPKALVLFPGAAQRSLAGCC